MNEQLNVRLGSSITTFLWSFAMLLLGIAIGFHWQPSYAAALGIVVFAGIFAVLHEVVCMFFWCSLTAWWIGRRTGAFDRKG